MELQRNASNYQSTNFQNYEPYVDARTAARFLGMHWKTVQRLAREHLLPAYSFSGDQRKQWKFHISELDKWAKARLLSSKPFVP
jgi:excisionase family DNA binding protein